MADASTPDAYDAVIVGGGPVGLFLGCRLAQLGLRFRVLERDVAPRAHSRSIGIHPPSLEYFEALGAVGGLLEKGVKVRRGLAFAGARPLGVLDFACLPGPYPFVLTLPQHETEAVLDAHLLSYGPGVLERGAEVGAVHAFADGVTVGYRHEGEEKRIAARFVVGCDGKESIVRRLAGLGFKGGPYGDSYLMGDFCDTSGLGADAAIYLAGEGLVESFPLPGGVRRWVVKTDSYRKDATVDDLCRVVEARVGHLLAPETSTMLSAFGVQRYLAESFVRNRVILAGDAAHVVSPIGGQGMNLGWFDAWALARALARIVKENQPHAPLLKAYNRRRMRAARAAIRRAEFNMFMGRKARLAALRDAGVGALLHSPFKRALARLFTMRGL